jgi:hypothetical protein
MYSIPMTTKVVSSITTPYEVYSIPMTTKVVSSITTPYEVYSIPIKTDHDITEIIMK